MLRTRSSLQAQHPFLNLGDLGLPCLPLSGACTGRPGPLCSIPRMQAGPGCGSEGPQSGSPGLRACGAGLRGHRTRELHPHVCQTFYCFPLGTGRGGSSGAVNPRPGLAPVTGTAQGDRGQPADMCPPGLPLSLQPPPSNHCLKIPKINSQL